MAFSTGIVIISYFQGKRERFNVMIRNKFFQSPIHSSNRIRDIIINFIENGKIIGHVCNCNDYFFTWLLRFVKLLVFKHFNHYGVYSALNR